MIRKSSTTLTASLHELDLAHEAMSAPLNDYFANGLDVESIERWSLAGSAKVRRNRQQFVSLFPSLAPMLALRPDDPFSDEICRAVDSGEELVRAIANEFDVSPSAVRHLRCVPWSIAMAERQRDEMDLLGCLEFIPQSHLPKSKEDWLTLWILIDSIGFSSFGPIGHVLRDLCCRGYDEAYQLAMDATRDDLFRLGDLHDYFGFVQRWAEGLLGEAGYSREIAQDSATLLLSSYRFPALWRQSLRWHGAILDPDVASAVEYQELRWQPLLPEPFVTEDLVIKPLNSANLLRTEGNAMEHCVATYTAKCARGEAHILSIQTLDGVRLSTVEISLVESRSAMVVPCVVQHRGHGNDDPPEAARTALSSLFAYWREPRAQEDLRVALKATRDGSTSLVVLDDEHDRLISQETCVRIMEQVYPNFAHCIASLHRISKELSTVDRKGPLLGNPILLPRWKRRTARIG